VEVHRHRVILNDRGQTVELMEEGYTDALGKLLSSEGVFTDGSASDNSVAEETQNYGVVQTGDQVFVTQQEVQKQVQSLGSLLAQVRVRPHIVRGRPQGFQIMHVRPGSFVQAAGIQSGDIVTQVNGQVVDTQQRAYEIFNGIQSDTQVNITIIRNDQERTIRYEMR
jgi:type II secretory pathway component PulC